MVEQSTSQDLVKRLKRLYVPLIADVMDDMGITQNIMDHSLRPIFPEAKVAGPAFTAKMFKLSKYPDYIPVKEGEWYKPLVEMIESIEEGQVIVLETDNATEVATWGELLSNAAKAMGAVGAVTDGAVRDVPKILEIQPPFPVWARNLNPTDSKGRIDILEYNTVVRCGGVTVRAGDIIFGDLDGVVVIPKEKTKEIIYSAEELFEKERLFRQAVRNGTRLSDAVERYKVF